MGDADFSDSDLLSTPYSSVDQPALFAPANPLGPDGLPVIRKVLIANRGEIACRVIRTCRRLGVVSVAVYVEEDAFSSHVPEADEAVCLGSVNQAEGNPFLNINLLVRTATSVGADAIHPGYGYLSESADFCAAVRKAGIRFIGPGPEAMSTLGHKRSAKEYLRKHAPSVPLIPGFAGTSQDSAELERAADGIGYPVMLKASAGGGGRGMRIVHERGALEDALQRVRSEASRSFGSDDCILEKYIEAGKHIEVQIMGDAHGNVVALWERECSMQRRHQKVIEETPSPWLSPERRRDMCDVAVQIGRLLKYESAGTVEFVVDVRDGSFYFLEVNTRLQVEHPITEEVTGLDMVALQLYAAAGGNFADLAPLHRIPQRGHAIECRLCAEDPSRDFMPEHGTIRLWTPKPAHSSQDVRFESAVRTGSDVSIHFDSMIAKIIVWAPTRTLAIEKMAQVLSQTACVGVTTNQRFLRDCLVHPGFRDDPAYTTTFIPVNLASLLGRDKSSPPHEAHSLSLSLIPCIFLREAGNKPGAFQNVRGRFRNQRFDRIAMDVQVIECVRPHETPQRVLCNWVSSKVPRVGKHRAHLTPLPDLASKPENGGKGSDKVAWGVSTTYNSISNMLRSGRAVDEMSHAFDIDLSEVQWHPVSPQQPGWRSASLQVVISGGGAQGEANTITTDMVFDTSSKRLLCHFPILGTWIEYRCSDLLSFMESLRDVARAESDAASLSHLKVVKAPMPCKILSLIKGDGEQVEKGAVVMVLESMKMEVNIFAPASGKFCTAVKEGEAFDEGKDLCWIE